MTEPRDDTSDDVLEPIAGDDAPVDVENGDIGVAEEEEEELA